MVGLSLNIPDGRRLGDQGVFVLPLASALMILCLSGFGIWGVLRNWKMAVETQLRLDQCVGKVALEFRDTLNSVARANQRIHQTRAAIVAATVPYPEAAVVLKKGLTILVLKQEIDLKLWQAKRVRWMIKRGCCERGDLSFPLPTLEVTRPSPDAIGEKALTSLSQDTASYRIQVVHHKFADKAALVLGLVRGVRGAAAEIKGGSLGSISEVKSWSAIWTPLSSNPGTSVH